ncbi:polyphosphate--glucose phosphotransferase [Mobilicoccus pelagius]|uniref:Polyphosphate-dependent glucokinase n=1 Tax=Mobilicoccus pelagius NBRC 104925 TaxID=1089455 RepID=H5UQ32_9MICO|nr:ROK family protein [Mobilicoccus pelagius]GAB47837.1 polyphosphate-dependent glucokinase [Mobilicoccus pelagius NBRC 104925]
MTRSPLPLGIDIGGSGIKGAPVDLETGSFAADRIRIETPGASTPKAVIKIVKEIAGEFESQCGDGPVGVTVPAVTSGGVVHTAANIDKGWIGADAGAMLTEALGRPVHLLNDADAAGVGEMQYGSGRGAQGTVLVVTLGTGIGSALFVDGILVPNTELGHLEIDGHDAEKRASNGAREADDLSWEKWAKRLQRYFRHVENLFWPDLIVIGGGISKKSDKYLPLLDIRTPIVPATLRNDAGIIGAAWIATQKAGRPGR